MGLFKDGAKDVGCDLVDKTTDSPDASNNDTKKNDEQLDNGKKKSDKSDKNKNSSSKKDDNSDANLKKLMGSPSQALAQNVVDGVVGDKDKKDDDTKALKKVSKGAKQLAKAPGVLGSLKGGVLGSFLTNGGLAGLIKAGIGALFNIAKLCVSGIALGVANFVGGMVSGIAGAFSGAVAAVSGALSVGTAVASTIVLTGATTVVVGAVGVVGSSVLSDPSIYDSGTNEDCYTKVAEAKEATENDSGDDAALAEANAKKLYSVFHQYGWSNNMIAGMLGNFDVEGGIDETSVEGIYDERHHIGEQKKKALEDPDSYISDVLFGVKYVNKGYDINNWLVDPKKPHDKQTNPYACVLGLAQWTGGRSNKFYNLSKQLNIEWTNLTFQMAYIIYEDQGSRSCFGGVDMNGKSASECALQFTTSYEGNTASDIAKRQSSAEYWAEKLSSWSSSESDLQTVTDMVKQMGVEADTKAVTEANSKCSKKAANADNSSIATAAVSYAWKTMDEGANNDGTELYRAVHDAVFPGDPLYQSCDRSTGAAIRWCGADVNFPAGGCTQQFTYCIEAPEKWQDLGVFRSSVKLEDLQPGDILISNGEHIVTYVGNEIIKQKYPDADDGANSVDGSIAGPPRSPGCWASATWIATGGDSREYHVFRCIKPDNSDQYKDVGVGKSGTS